MISYIVELLYEIKLAEYSIIGDYTISITDNMCILCSISNPHIFVHVMDSVVTISTMYCMLGLSYITLRNDKHEFIKALDTVLTYENRIREVVK